MSNQRVRRSVLLTAIVTAAGAGAASWAVRGAPASDPASPADLADLAFMTGHWRAEWQGDRLEEHFSEPRSGTMIGMFRWMEEDSTGLTEHMVLEQREDGVHFFLRHFHPGSVPWEQEADGPMHLRLTRAGDGRAVFEHPDLLFPARIIYHRTQPDTLVVRLEGRREDGAEREMEFNFRSTGMTTSTETLTQAGQSIGYNGDLTIAVQVKDIAASIDWYQKVVGFKLLYHVEEMGWCELSTSVDSVSIGLSQVEKPKVGGPTPTFGVADIEHARSRLEDQGVRFDGPTLEFPGMVKLATFFDPDGNALMLSQALSQQHSE